MDIVVKVKKDNPLLERQELELEVSYLGATPSNADVKKAISQHFKVDENTILIKYIYTSFGATKADVLAFIYNDPQALGNIELIKKKPKKKKEAAPEKKK